jgi:hypothetical protein
MIRLVDPSPRSGFEMVVEELSVQASNAQKPVFRLHIEGGEIPKGFKMPDFELVKKQAAEG